MMSCSDIGIEAIRAANSNTITEMYEKGKTKSQKLEARRCALGNAALASWSVNDTQLS